MDGLVDYAKPCMMAEQALKEVHLAMLRRDFHMAREHAFDVLADTKLMMNAIDFMQEQEDALRQQTVPVQERV